MLSAELQNLHLTNWCLVSGWTSRFWKCNISASSSLLRDSYDNQNEQMYFWHEMYCTPDIWLDFALLHLFLRKWLIKCQLFLPIKVFLSLLPIFIN